ncbi:hypothetical protein JCM10450v2_001526 [Rhodotorula kratochvilovae]
MLRCATFAALFATLALVRAAPIPADTKGTSVTVVVDAASKAAVATVSYKELCYLEFKLQAGESSCSAPPKKLSLTRLLRHAEKAQTRYTKDQLIKDTDGKDVVLNDGYKKDESGRETYYVSYCYASSSVKGSTSENKQRDSTTTANPFVDIIDGMNIQSGAGFGGSSGLLASLVGGGSGGASGLLKKRQMLDGLGGLDGSSFGRSPFGGSLGGSLGGSPLSSFGSSPLESLDSPFGSSSPFGDSSPLGGDSLLGGGVNPAANFDPSSAIKSIGSSDQLASQNGLIGDGGRNLGNLGEGRGGEDAALPSSAPSSAPNRPSTYHARQSSVDEEILHSDSRQTITSVPSRLSGARTTSASAPRSSFVPVQLAQPGGPTIAVAAVSQATPTAEGQEYSIQTVVPTAVA